MGVLALALGILTIAGSIQLWHVYAFAFLFGSAAAFDASVRQTFVAELVGDEHLHKCGRAQFVILQCRPYGRSRGRKRSAQL